MFLYLVHGAEHAMDEDVELDHFAEILKERVGSWYIVSTCLDIIHL